MAEHLLQSSLTLPLPRPVVFACCADVANLEHFSPPDLGVNILSALPLSMAVGTTINYRMEVFAVPFQCTNVITAWAPPDYFIEEQKKGPYRLWIHRHDFRDSADGGTVVEDLVRYRLPLLPFGDTILPLVQRELERIFAYRRTVLQQLLLTPDGKGSC